MHIAGSLTSTAFKTRKAIAKNKRAKIHFFYESRRNKFLLAIQLVHKKYRNIVNDVLTY